VLDGHTGDTIVLIQVINKESVVYTQMDKCSDFTY
jgi:hypothetical protein